MKRSTWVLLALAVIAVLGMIAWKIAIPILQDKQVQETSESGKLEGVLKGAVDDWVGYFHVSSKKMKQKMRQAGWRLDIVDDQANYHERMKKLSDGEYDFIVATVDSYLLNSANDKYPGAITFVIDESKGGDCVYALKDRGENLEAFKGQKVRVAFTPDSPSHHVLKAMKSHFGLDSFTPPKGSVERVETAGAKEAYEKITNGLAEVASMWEPYCAKASTNPKLVRLFSTKETAGYIVDILVMHRKLLVEQPAVAKKFVAAYFSGLKHYVENPEEMTAEIKEATGLDETAIKQMIAGISWQNLTDNATRWFGISSNGENVDENIVAAIEATASVLVANNDFKKNPLPKEDPYQLFNKDLVEDLYLRGMGQVLGVPLAVGGQQFSALSPEGWNNLKVVGTLKVDPVNFQIGSAVLSLEGKLVLDELATKIKQYSMYRAKVVGHTSTDGDPEANRNLSKDRSDSVVQYMNVVHNMEHNRFLSVGVGGDEPLSQLPDESERQWAQRLKRVEIIFLREEY